MKNMQRLKVNFRITNVILFSSGMETYKYNDSLSDLTILRYIFLRYMKKVTKDKIDIGKKHGWTNEERLFHSMIFFTPGLERTFYRKIHKW